jgi:Fe-S-cluster containining protein
VSVSEPQYLSLAHERFRRVDAAIFVRRVVADCLRHSCVMVADDGHRLPHPRPLLEACCQYGADTDLGERDAILARREQIAPLLDAGARDAPWFTTTVEEDPDYPSGRHVRTETLEGGCIFLAHDKRGCAIHRAAAEQGWDIDGVKPNICRLFPLSYDGDLICISDDYDDYDCADAPGAPTLYRVGRDTLAAIFGPALVAALDAVESAVAASKSQSQQQQQQPPLVQLRAHRA